MTTIFFLQIIWKKQKDILSEPFKIGTGNAVEFEDPFGNRLGVTDYIK